MNKLTILFGAAVIVLCLAGCHGSASADIRYRIFEASLDAVDEVVPKETRTKLGDSGYWAAYLSREEIASLQENIPSDHGLLFEKSRRISWWPGIADTWTYAYSYDNADGEMTGGRGGGAGTLGVRHKGASHEIRIEYVIRHHFDECKPIRSEVNYEGIAPNEGIVFIRPMECKNGTDLVHIVAFEIGNWR